MPTWDESKRQRNLRVHGMDFTGCEAVFDSPVVTWDDDRMAYGELRINSYTERGDEPHIISLRKAEKHEVRYYYAQAIAR